MKNNETRKNVKMIEKTSHLRTSRRIHSLISDVNKTNKKLNLVKI